MPGEPLNKTRTPGYARPPLLVGVGKEGPTDRPTDKAFCRPTPLVWQKGGRMGYSLPRLPIIYYLVVKHALFWRDAATSLSVILFAGRKRPVPGAETLFL